MLQGILLFAVAAATGISVAPTVRADSATSGASCSMLADIVYERVLAHGLDIRPGRAIAREAAAEIECERAVEAVSEGFTRAMHAMNVYLSWKSPARTRGDLCLDVHLEHCYPDQNPLAPSRGADRAFVLDAWSAVQSAVTVAIPGCHAAGVHARFSPADLRRHLDWSLDTRIRDGRQQAYYFE